MIKIIDQETSIQNQDELKGLVRSIFKPDGLLQKTLDFEHRAEQEEMAMSVLESIEEKTSSQER